MLMVIQLCFTNLKMTPQMLLKNCEIYYICSIAKYIYNTKLNPTSLQDLNKIIF